MVFWKKATKRQLYIMDRRILLEQCNEHVPASKLIRICSLYDKRKGYNTIVCRYNQLEGLQLYFIMRSDT